MRLVIAERFIILSPTLLPDRNPGVRLALLYLFSHMDIITEDINKSDKGV